MSYRNRPKTEKEMFREIFRRLDDLERIPVFPVERRGDQIWYVDPSDGAEYILNPVTRIGDEVYYQDPNDGTQILLAPECPCDEEPPPTGERSVWTSASLAPGDDTWTSACGDERRLLPEIARGISDPGLAYTGRARRIVAFETGDLFADYPSGEIATLDIDITTTWTIDAGHYEDHFQLDLVGGNGGNQVWRFEPVGGLDHLLDNVGPFPSPAQLAFDPSLQNLSYPNEFDAFELNPAGAGLTGRMRGVIRLTHNPSTGEIGASLGPTVGSLVSQGSFTNPALTSLAGLRFELAQKGASRAEDYNYPHRLQADVLHGYRAWTPTSGTIYEVTQADIEALAQTFTFENPLNAPYVIGGSQLGSHPSLSPSPTQTHRFAAGCFGSPPLYFNPQVVEWDPFAFSATYTSPPVQPIFNSGTALGSPAIAVSKPYQPTEITIVNTDPLSFAGLDDGFDASCFVWAVADLDTFDPSEIDANGWPTGYYPFGTLGT
jgi:hypothetical protein